MACALKIPGWFSAVVFYHEQSSSGTMNLLVHSFGNSLRREFTASTTCGSVPAGKNSTRSRICKGCCTRLARPEEHLDDQRVRRVSPVRWPYPRHAVPTPPAPGGILPRLKHANRITFLCGRLRALLSFQFWSSVLFSFQPEGRC